MTKQSNPIFNYKLMTLALLSALGANAHAATQPDAGQILQEVQPKTIQPMPQGQTLQLPEPGLLKEQAGGQSVQLKSVTISGNTVFTQEQLQAVLGDVTQQPLDIGGMRRLANQISQYYRDHGYPFARAYLPAQKLTDGVLKIDVLEGRYGQVLAKGELGQEVQPFLNPLQPGDLIQSSKLERTTLLISDLPGIQITPVMKPGAQTGQGDLDLQVKEGKRYNGLVSLDNHGNRYTGANRLMASINANRLATLGDELSVSVMRTDEGMWFGNIGYSLPVGTDGLKATIGYSRTTYELGQDYASLDAFGVADVVSAGLKYPLIRSQQTNVMLGAEVQRKTFTDETGSTDTKTDKSTNTLPLSLAFDHRDALGGGGVTYGSLTFTAGDLNIETDSVRQSDATTAETQGTYLKTNLDIARIQNIANGFSGYARVSGQWSNKNLDSSEDMSLGGPRGVRAYPQGEASGDHALLGQIEVRYQYQDFTPY
ncbi:MAG: ShlB/FhaC/HecB family hemolysin secretion/activation protein, partial [Gammaproteobacteria bacterium]|nr:ShlB/FhaC/HecB family hemolysin secretion/activation protein [Gammaproteobacteria bacterium]MBD3815848.1 ShlB/FhaC/HecB family hemolysin secretion/activation protein [Halothiobacillus sp.]